MYTDDDNDEGEEAILNFSKFNSSNKSGDVVQLNEVQHATDADVILQL